MDPVIPFEKIASQAMSAGASLVGAAHIATLLDSPSHRFYPVDRRVREACSVVVLALAHPDGHPEMDWWDSRQGGTPGNRLLMHTTRSLIKWLRKSYSVEAFKLPYHADKRGIFLKDAAVLAGLGVIGKNNLLITPQYGPRVRLRALLLKRSLQSTGPLDGFAPCAGCEGHCLHVCSREAFRGGFYQRKRCLLQMKKNESDKIMLQQPVVGMPAEIRIAYCRMCELSCPVGK